MKTQDPEPSFENLRIIKEKLNKTQFYLLFDEEFAKHLIIDGSATFKFVICKKSQSQIASLPLIQVYL